MGPEINLNGRTQAVLVGFRGSERASTFFRRGRDMEYIRRGMKFRRIKPDNTVETAQVLSVVLDGLRIPHVRYEINLTRLNTMAIHRDGPRILALSAFTNTYRERVPN